MCGMRKGGAGINVWYEKGWGRYVCVVSEIVDVK